jgi:hypothetical protein
LEEYSDEAHFSTVKAAVQYSETCSDTYLQNQDDFFPDFEGEDYDSYLLHQNPTKPPLTQKNSLEHFLSVQSSTGHLKCATTLNFVFVHVQVIPDHGGKTITSLFMMIMDARELP